MPDEDFKLSYGLYIGKNHTRDGHAWLAGYGDEPSSHWLEIVPRQSHEPGSTIEVGVDSTADLPGLRTRIPQVSTTARHIRVSYSYYMGVPAPITNGGLNAHGVAVRDIWSPSRDELVAMTPKDQTGPNYSDFARIVIERAQTAREGVEIIGELIKAYGESSYGGNSHIIADPDEAWVVIQFAGGQGLWVAERLGADSIRASRPGYIELVPVDEPRHPDFLYPEHFVDLAIEKGWYESGPFDANQVYGDGKGRWEGVRWIEAEMSRRASEPAKIGLQDMMWAMRTPKLTGDTAGYGQVVPLVHPVHNSLRMIWHSAIGAVAAPFVPVFMGQDVVPPEYGKHRYLTRGEGHRFLDLRKFVEGDQDSLSHAQQQTEMHRSAVYECKRLFYLMLQQTDRFADEVHEVFDAHEANVIEHLPMILKSAEISLTRQDETTANQLLEYFSTTEMSSALNLVQVLADSIEARIRALGLAKTDVQMFDQIW